MSVVSRGLSLALLLTTVLALPVAAGGDEVITAPDPASVDLPAGSTPSADVSIGAPGGASNASVTVDRSASNDDDFLELEIKQHYDRGYNELGEGCFQHAWWTIAQPINNGQNPRGNIVDLGSAEDDCNTASYLASSPHEKERNLFCQAACQMDVINEILDDDDWRPSVHWLTSPYDNLLLPDTYGNCVPGCERDLSAFGDGHARISSHLDAKMLEDPALFAAVSALADTPGGHALLEAKFVDDSEFAYQPSQWVARAASRLGYEPGEQCVGSDYSLCKPGLRNQLAFWNGGTALTLSSRKADPAPPEPAPPPPAGPTPEQQARGYGGCYKDCARAMEATVGGIDAVATKKKAYKAMEAEQCGQACELVTDPGSTFVAASYACTMDAKMGATFEWYGDRYPAVDVSQCVAQATTDLKQSGDRAEAANSAGYFGVKALRWGHDPVGAAVAAVESWWDDPDEGASRSTAEWAALVASKLGYQYPEKCYGPLWHGGSATPVYFFCGSSLAEGSDR